MKTITMYQNSAGENFEDQDKCLASERAAIQGRASERIAAIMKDANWNVLDVADEIRAELSKGEDALQELAEALEARAQEKAAADG